MLYIISSGEFDHRQINEYGENIFYSKGSEEVKGADVVLEWYREIKDYEFDNPGYSDKTGHFSQVIWREFSQLGIANYNPKGNIDDQFNENVPNLIN